MGFLRNTIFETLWVRFCFFLALLWTLIIATLAIPFLLFFKKIGHVLEQFFATVWCWLLGVEAVYENLEVLKTKKNFVLAPNHQSLMDIMVLYRLPLKFHWIAKKQLSRIPFFGWALKACGTYFVNRDSSGHDVKVVMKEVEDGLISGESVLMFPEGTRSRTGQLGPFKKGAFKVAQNTQVPLLPIAILGTYGIVPPKSLPKRWGHKVIVKLGNPFYVGPEEDMSVAMGRFRIELIRLLEEQGV